jgi:hypothetical protein
VSSQRIEQDVTLPRNLRLVAWAPQEGGGSMASLMGQQGRKRPRGAADDTNAPPLARLGLPGVSSFNDATFDISGEQQLAASQVVRGPSNVLPSPTTLAAGLVAAAPLQQQQQQQQQQAHDMSIPGGGLSAWRANIPMPEVTHEPSFGLPREASLAREPSFGFPLRGLSMSGVVRDHSLALPRDGSLGGLGMVGVGRDTSFGSFHGDIGDVVGRDDSLKGLSGLSALSDPLKSGESGGH